MTRNHGQQKKQEPPKREQFRLSPPQSPDEPQVEVLQGRERTKITSFEGFRPALLDLGNSLLANVQLLSEKSIEKANEDKGSLFYLEKVIGRQSDAMKTIATLCPIGFYAAVDPVQNVIDTETERLKALAEIAAQPLIKQTGDVEVS